SGMIQAVVDQLRPLTQRAGDWTPQGRLEHFVVDKLEGVSDTRLRDVMQLLMAEKKGEGGPRYHRRLVARQFLESEFSVALAAVLKLPPAAARDILDIVAARWVDP